MGTSNFQERQTPPSSTPPYMYIKCMYKLLQLPGVTDWLIGLCSMYSSSLLGNDNFSCLKNIRIMCTVLKSTAIIS